MPGALGDDTQAGLLSSGQHVGHLSRVRRVCDRGRVVLNLQVPRRARHVVAGVTRQVNGAAAQPAQGRCGQARPVRRVAPPQVV